MGRAPCCDKASVKKGPWSPEEDAHLKEYIEKYGTGGNWISLPQKAGLKRCGKSCRLRWLNYLRPNIKHGEFSDDEDRIICSLYANIGSRWSIIAAQLPGRTDNDIKNYWNTKLKKKFIRIVPSSQKRSHHSTTYPSTSLFQTLTSSSPPYSSPSAAPTSSFTGYDIMSIPSSFMNISSSSSNARFSTVLQAQEYGYVGSCSSSDGSCNNLIISPGKEVEYEFGVSNGENMGLHGYLYDGVNVNNGYVDENQNGVYVDNPLDYSLEDIKQLISTNISNNNLNFFIDDNKAEEKVMYY